MTVVPEKSAGTAQYNGTSYYFCSKGCLQKFTVDPDRYLSAKPDLRNMQSGLVQLGAAKPVAKPTAKSSIYVCRWIPRFANQSQALSICGMALEPEEATPSSRVEYTCPMHPEVISDAPGFCPFAAWLSNLESLTLHRRRLRTPRHDTTILDQRRVCLCHYSLFQWRNVRRTFGLVFGQGLVWLQFALATPWSFGVDGPFFSADGLP